MIEWILDTLLFRACYGGLSEGVMLIFFETCAVFRKKVGPRSSKSRSNVRTGYSNIRIFERVIISVIELCLLLPRIMRHGLGKAHPCKFRSLSHVCNELKWNISPEGLFGDILPQSHVSFSHQPQLKMFFFYKTQLH